MNMKISVVVPTYRRPDLLFRCLEALALQQFDKKEYEVIVVSDGPDESAQQIVNKFSYSRLRLSFFSTEIKNGPASARNLGWKLAKGQLIAFTDDDCIPAKTWLKNIWEAYCGEDEIVFTGKVRVPISKNPTDYELNIANLETAEFVTANCVCTKQALIKTGGFDKRFAAAWREDSDLHFKLLLHNIPIKQISAEVVHPVRKAPWGISIKEQKKGMYNALLYKKYPLLYRQRIKPAPSWNYYLMTLGFLIAVIGLIVQLKLLASAGALIWFTLLIRFIQKRLKTASRDTAHIFEMVVTSLFIPFLSIYWQLYGAYKYRVLFF